MACAAGCAPSGEDPRSTLSVYEPPGGEYRLRYLDPPWELVRAEGTSALVRVRSNAMIYAGPEAGPPKYDLAVTVEAGSVGARIAAEQTAARLRGETVVDGPRRVAADGGRVEGQEILTLGSFGPLARYGRYAFFPVDDGRVVRLAFEATPMLETPEVDAMIDQLGIGASAP